jgi:hypothetical protein
MFISGKSWGDEKIKYNLALNRQIFEYISTASHLTDLTLIRVKEFGP